MFIQLPNADFSGNGLGKAVLFTHGMPSEDLLGLWLFDEGNDGDPFNSVADKSGNGNHATLRTNWTAGVKRTYGMEVTTNQGTALQTALPINPSGRQMTVFVAGANTLPGNETNQYNNWFGSTDNPGMDQPTLSHTNAPSLCLNYQGLDDTPRWQAFDAGGDMIGTSTLGADANQPDYDEPTVAALEIDGINDAVALHVLGAPMLTATDARVGMFYDGATNRGNLEFGPWPHVNRRSAASTIAHVYAVAVYARTFTDTEAQRHMGFMRQIAEARGVLFPA